MFGMTPALAPAGPAPAGAGRRVTGPTVAAKLPLDTNDRMTLGLRLVMVLWFIVCFDPQWWVASKFGITAVLKFPLGIFALLFLCALSRWPRRAPFLIYGLYVAYHWLTLPIAYNPGYAMLSAKQQILFLVLGLGTIAFVKNPRRVEQILGIAMLWEFVFYGLLGARSGLVWWHPSLANFDGFGPLMVIGLGGVAHYALGHPGGRIKWIAYGATLLCLIGFMSSWARGAFLGAVAVLGFAWLRSPRKGIATAMVLGLVAAMGLAAVLLFSNMGGRGRGGTRTSFIAEMLTIQDTEGGTAEDRKVLWGAAWQIFKEHPVFGVGGDGFGPYAAGYYRPGEIAGDYAGNPLVLYDRKLHSTYLQILCERGAVGALLFLLVLADFWRRNVQLRRQRWRAAWRERGGTLDLRWIALGLESMMVGFLATGVFYNQLEVHWMYTTLIANALVWYLARPPAAVPAHGRGGAA